MELTLEQAVNTGKPLKRMTSIVNEGLTNVPPNTLHYNANKGKFDYVNIDGVRFFVVNKKILNFQPRKLKQNDKLSTKID